MVKGYPSRIPAIPWRISASPSGYPPGDTDLALDARAAAPPVAAAAAAYLSSAAASHHLPPRPTSPRCQPGTNRPATPPPASQEQTNRPPPPQSKYLPSVPSDAATMLTPIGSDRFADRLCLPFDLASDTLSLARNDDSVQYIVACEERRQALPLLDNLPPASHRRQSPHRCQLVVATSGAYFACPQRAFKAFWCVFGFWFLDRGVPHPH
ncbi:hypothetical protein PGTUg99_008226 [Puccinia graminis f. sp. tritici]|uniref:Uncharacterized protein n=1 Tax=Puccinia graminis f. sp. tritici TaxID=56615 RepID=A0A5B0SC51_PUCGR|nr:hypothetical protein PGTUg99_008226 [Puccinia graminis f. sp. tritici]